MLDAPAPLPVPEHACVRRSLDSVLDSQVGEQAQAQLVHRGLAPVPWVGHRHGNLTGNPPALHDEDAVGRTVRVDGPAGDFWLRPGTAPLLFVAGGSCLAPILAILQEALAAG